MTFFQKISIIAGLSILASLPALTQNPLNQLLQPSSGTTTAAKTVADPYDRTTPSGTIFGFLQAAQSGNYSVAVQYLQMSPARRQSEGEQVAAKLKVVMDRALAGSLKRVSTQPEGTPQEGVPPDRQNLGIMSSGDVEAELQLVRISDPTVGKIWLISSDTLTKVPELYDEVEARQVENRLPHVLVKHQLGGMPLWQWLALLLAVPVAALGGWIVLVIVDVPLNWWAQKHGHVEVVNWRSVSGPAWLLVGTLAHRFFAAHIGMGLLPRHYYYELTSVALIVSANWLLWRAIRWFLRRVRNRALAHGHGGTGSLMLLGERILKAAVFVMAVLAVFGSLGFNMSTALAGLGIGGLAIGFGAQKTIENLFGGVSVLGDEVIRVGDVCRFGDRTGTVEDIGLRSTRVRTDERTLLAIPNGTVATINVENLSRRDKILFQTNIGVRPDTKSDHMQYVLSEIRRLFDSHSKIEKASLRVRLTQIAAALNVEIFSYVLTTDYNEFAAVREELLLGLMSLVEDSGTGVALPSQTLYIRRDSGLEKEKTENAVKKISELRQQQSKNQSLRTGSDS
ncbi:MAG TPA: mechanosensitive ion channel domain-containing protein [Candidatus Sulfotelmatobacter sp.]